MGAHVQKNLEKPATCEIVCVKQISSLGVLRLEHSFSSNIGVFFFESVNVKM